MPSISFVCPLQNKSRYLLGAIAALERQAPTHERQFIFIDDGSSDGSFNLVKAMTKHWSNCVYIRQDNTGPAGCANTGISYATGDYLKFLGCDDILAPFATDQLLECLDSTGAVAAYSRKAYYGDISEVAFTVDNRKSVSLIEDPLAIVIDQTITGLSQSLFRTAAVRAGGGCDPRVFTEDFSLALRLALLGPFILLDKMTAYGPTDTSERIGIAREQQVLHDYNLALALFFQDHPELKKQYGRLALRRCAERAEKWARRRSDGKSLLRCAIMRTASWLPGFDHAAMITATLSPFSADGTTCGRKIIQPTARDIHTESSESSLAIYPAKRPSANDSSASI
ncbi:glycosyltransferase family 2 protein [Telmatospirillum siberiense]|nr:glycosyltransferase family A protein [Telmatospirillum siberiense]